MRLILSPAPLQKIWDILKQLPASIKLPFCSALAWILLGCSLSIISSALRRCWLTKSTSALSTQGVSPWKILPTAQSRCARSLCPEGASYCHTPIYQLKLPQNLLIGLIRRKPAFGQEVTTERILFPKGQDCLVPGDQVTARLARQR